MGGEVTAVVAAETMKNEWQRHAGKIKMEVVMRGTEPSGKHSIRGLNQSPPEDN